jgi:hypothetical protein
MNVEYELEIMLMEAVVIYFKVLSQHFSVGNKEEEKHSIKIQAGYRIEPGPTKCEAGCDVRILKFEFLVAVVERCAPVRNKSTHGF